MAWTTPRTWAASELVTATLMNTHVRDNLNALRDYMLGAQDLGSNWLVSGGRSLSMSDSDVAHGMTALAATAVYGVLGAVSSTDGGFGVIGYSDTDAVGLSLVGRIGTTTPTAAAIRLTAQKKNGTTAQAIGSSEVGIDWSMGGATLGRIYGSGGFNIEGGMSLGYAGVPVAGALTIGNSLFRLIYAASQVPALIFDNGTSPASGIYYEQVSGVYSINCGSTTAWQVQTSQVGPVSGGSVGINMNIGAAGTGAAAGSILFHERADPSPPDANRCTLYAKDNGAGKTLLVAIFSSGAVQTIATQP